MLLIRITADRRRDVLTVPTKLNNTTSTRKDRGRHSDCPFSLCAHAYNTHYCWTQVLWLDGWVYYSLILVCGCAKRLGEGGSAGGFVFTSWLISDFYSSIKMYTYFASSLQARPMIWVSRASVDIRSGEAVSYLLVRGNGEKLFFPHSSRWKLLTRSHTTYDKEKAGERASERGVRKKSMDPFQPSGRFYTASFWNSDYSYFNIQLIE